jgi:hypothetical protein
MKIRQTLTSMLTLGLLVFAFASGCASQARRNVVIGPDGSPIGGGFPGSGSAVFSSEISQAELANLGVTDPARLTYRLNYLGENRVGDIVVNELSGGGSIVERDLPAGRSGELALEILQDGVVLARGMNPNVQLIPGQANRVSLALTRVAPPTVVQPPSGPAVPDPVPTAPPTTNLTIDISIDSGKPATMPRPPSSSTPAPPTSGGPSVPPPYVDLGGWDGVSNVGSGNWVIPATR